MPTTYNFNSRNLASEPTANTNTNGNWANSFLNPTIASNQTTGKYPIDVNGGIVPYYQPDCTAYIQKGDTVNYTLSNPASGQTTYTYVRSANGVAAQSYPNPANGGNGAGSYSGSGGQVHTEPTTFTYTWPTNLVDNQSSNGAINDTMWPWNGNPQVAAGQTYAGSFSMSRKCRIRVVTGTLSLNKSTVNPEGSVSDRTVRITGVNLSGLFAPNHNISVHANKFYVTFWKPDGNIFTTFSSSSGITFDPAVNSSQYKGWLHQNTQYGAKPFIDVIIGSSMPEGVYTIYINHYNASDSYNSQREFGTTTRMHSVQLTVAGTPDTTPNAFAGNMGTLTRSGLATSGVAESTIATLTGTNQPAAISVSGSGGAANPQYRYRANSSSSFTSYTTSAGNIPAGYQFQLKVSTSTAASTQSTGTLTIGGVSATMTLTTAAAGSSGTGGSAAGAGNYGLEVRNASGVVTFSPSRRTTSFISSSTSTFGLTAGQTSGSFNAEGITTNNSTDVAILINIGGTSSSFSATSLSVNRGNGTFTITNTGNTDLTNISWIAVRY